MSYSQFKQVLQSNKCENVEEYAKQNSEEKFVFRNYHPKMQSSKFEFEPTTHLRIITSVTNELRAEIKEFIDNFLNEEKQQLNIIPKKSNIDLKRQVAKQQDILNQRTELSIISLLKEKCEIKETKPQEEQQMEEEKPEVKKEIFMPGIVYDRTIDQIQEDEIQLVNLDGKDIVQNLNIQAQLFDKLDKDSDSNDDEF